MAWREHLRIAMMMGLLVLALTACDFVDDSTVDVAVTADGEAIGLDREGFVQGAAEPATGIGTQLEVDLPDGTLIRIDRQSIVESTDGFETSEVVWQIEPDANWWGHEFGPIRPELFDIVELPDGSAAAAAGAIGIVERQPDGEWTPTVAELRTLPTIWILLSLAGVSTMTLSLMMSFGPLAHGRSFARGATVLLLPFTAFSLLALHGNTSVIAILAFLFTPLAVQAFGTTIGAVLRSEATPGYVLNFAAIGSVIIGLQTVIYGSLYLLWSRDIWSYGQAVLGVALTPMVLIAVGVVVLNRRVGATSLPTGPAIPTIGWFMSFFLGVVIPMCVSFIAAFGAAALVDWPTWAVIVLTAVWFVGFAGLAAYMTWRSHYAVPNMASGLDAPPPPPASPPTAQPTPSSPTLS